MSAIFDRNYKSKPYSVSFGQTYPLKKKKTAFCINIYELFELETERIILYKSEKSSTCIFQCSLAFWKKGFPFLRFIFLGRMGRLEERKKEKNLSSNFDAFSVALFFSTRLYGNERTFFFYSSPVMLYCQRVRNCKLNI